MYHFISVIDIVYDAIVVRTVRFAELLVSSNSESESHQEVVHEITNEHTESEDTLENTPRTFKTIQEILSVQVIPQSTATKNTIMYAGTISVPVFGQPTIEFDSQIGEIPYGEMVMMMEPRGRFSRVVWNSLEGWVLREDLVDRAIGVYPEFITEQENSVDSTNTVHIRAILGDVFGLGRSEFSLQAGEYVLYRLWKKNIRLSWPATRPRVPGLWHKILRGVPGIYVGVVPKVGSIMEYMLNTDVGHLAYVEAVFPDETISISEANYPDSGIYNERELTKEEWKELRPVFISVT